MSYIVYAHVNENNHKRYIGITSQNFERRCGYNGRNYHDSPKFWNAIQKYGWNSFQHIVIEQGLSKEEAREKEKYYIELFDSIQNGYNISKGGDVPPVLIGQNNPNYHRIFSEETKRKMKENHADFTREKHPRARKVQCVETGEIFNTITDAAEKYNVARKCINDTCTGRQKTSCGMHWIYIDLIS